MNEPDSPNSAEQYHHGNLRQTLLDAAVDALKTRSVEQLSLRALAREAGVSQTAPYRHFKDKDQLLVELAQQGFDELTACLLEGRTASDSTAETMLICGRGYLKFALGNPEKYRLMFGKGLPDKSRYPELEASGMRAFGVLLDWVTRGIEKGDIEGHDPELAAFHIWSCVHGLASLVIEGRAHCTDLSATQQLIEANLQMICQRMLVQ